MRIGMIGVGLMGQGIARNLVKNGHVLRFLDHPGNQPVEDLVAQGAEAVESPRAVAEGAEVLLLCVTGAPQVEAVLTGEAGALAGLEAGAIVVDCSTSLPEMTLAMGKRAAEAGGDYLDAPMTRTAPHAQAGTLNLLVGGEAAALAKVAPMLDCFTESVLHVGPLGSGHRMKLLHNFVSIGFATLLAEAAAQAKDGGVSPEMLVRVLGEGGGASVALDRLAPFVLKEDRSGLPFSVANGAKDIDYYLQMTRAAGARDSVASGINDALAAALAADGSEAWLPELVRIFGKGNSE
ncbi:MAG: NAD(P)-dependent oxidoreductase [Sulfitobacter sp.]|nr:NAD(P)-dependent oxidoreductase [Sulfitobacter sp.]